MRRIAMLLMTAALLAGCDTAKTQDGARDTPQTPAAAASPADRQVWFGELHLHTTISFDAYPLFGSRITPEQAYRFGRGEPIDYLGTTLQRGKPLDFMAVTDHAEYIGVLNQLDDPESALSKSGLGKLYHSDRGKFFSRILAAGRTRADPPELNVKAAMAAAWAREVAAADAAYIPGKFTTFAAFEWSPLAKGVFNMHRNVIFRDKPADAVYSSFDSEKPEDLWSYLERQRAKGIEVIAIPHNSNVSGGMMFDWTMSDGRPIDEAYAQRRAFNEPLVEIMQRKGQSETVPELSPADEFADFEIWRELLSPSDKPNDVNGSYARQALGRGLVLQAKLGANPYKFGFVSGSDSHTGLSNSEEAGYFGKGPKGENMLLPDGEMAKTTLSKTPPTRNVGFAGQGALDSSPGLTGVWAEANSRESIYDALRRKESFATSGTEIRLRFFGGWDLPRDMLRAPNWVKAAYRIGVPMGSDLPARASPGRGPGFILQAAKDPAGAHLDRIQIIKVWREGANYREKVFDVVWSPERRRDRKTGKIPAVRNTVDLATATYANSVGAAQLIAQWQDPEFDPQVAAVYYARALEIPTPRWSTRLAVRKGLPVPTHVAPTIQERAVSSPIWYTPPRN